MINPRDKTELKRLAEDGRAYVEVRKDVFILIKPMFIPLNTKQNVKKYGVKYMKFASRFNPMEMKLKRSVMEIGLDAVTAAKYMKEHDMITREQQEEFKTKKGNLEKFRFLYSITELRFVV